MNQKGRKRNYVSVFLENSSCVGMSSRSYSEWRTCKIGINWGSMKIFSLRTGTLQASRWFTLPVRFLEEINFTTDFRLPARDFSATLVWLLANRVFMGNSNPAHTERFVHSFIEQCLMKTIRYYLVGAEGSKDHAQEWTETAGTTCSDSQPSSICFKA